MRIVPGASQLCVFGVLGGLVLLTALVTQNGCAGVTPLSVGGGDPSTTDASSEASIAPTDDGGLTTTLLQKLEARCAAPPGPSDDFANAAELSARLQGRWYHCQSLSNWTDLQPGAGLELHFGPAGSYAFLNFDATTQSFVRNTDVDWSGEAQYLVYRVIAKEGGAPEGGLGDAGSSAAVNIPVDDTNTLNDIVLSLARTNLDNILFDARFSKGPRKLQLNELGGSPVKATFVPID